MCSTTPATFKDASFEYPTSCQNKVCTCGSYVAVCAQTLYREASVAALSVSGTTLTRLVESLPPPKNLAETCVTLSTTINYLLRLGLYFSSHAFRTRLALLLSLSCSFVYKFQIQLFTAVGFLWSSLGHVWGELREIYYRLPRMKERPDPRWAFLQRTLSLRLAVEAPSSCTWITGTYPRPPLVVHSHES